MHVGGRKTSLVNGKSSDSASFDQHRQQQRSIHVHPSAATQILAWRKLFQKLYPSHRRSSGTSARVVAAGVWAGDVEIAGDGRGETRGKRGGFGLRSGDGDGGTVEAGRRGRAGGWRRFQRRSI